MVGAHITTKFNKSLNIFLSVCITLWIDICTCSVCFVPTLVEVKSSATVKSRVRCKKSSLHGKRCLASSHTHMCSRDGCIGILWQPHMVANRYVCPSTSKLPPLHAATNALTTAVW